jgi:UDP-N-acetylglucosamine 2-epimerase
MLEAQKVITDSGGVQKESYLLGVPCITIRNNTEWVETLNDDWNRLTGTDPNKIVTAIVEHGPDKIHDYRDQMIFGSGKTSEIIRDALMTFVRN